MSRDFVAESEREARQSQAYKSWVGLRIRLIHDKVRPEDVLERYGVRLRHGGHRAEQFSCPFHGKDNKPSTRFYPSEGDKPSGVWCFVCQERWDAIALFKKFEELDGPFTRVLTLLERTFGLETPEMPRDATFTVEDHVNAEVVQLFEVCERRLKSARPNFTMAGYLQVGSVLDRLHYQVQHGRQTVAQATKILKQVLDKVGEKERATYVPASQTTDSGDGRPSLDASQM